MFAHVVRQSSSTTLSVEMCGVDTSSIHVPTAHTHIVWQHEQYVVEAEQKRQEELRRQQEVAADTNDAYESRAIFSGCKCS